MSDVCFYNAFVSHYSDHLIYITKSETDLYVKNSHFSYCYCADPGSVVYLTSGAAIIKCFYGFCCTSDTNREPGGAMIRIIHEETDKSNVTLSFLAYSNSPNSLNTYSAISLKYGIIKYSNINATKNTASNNPAFYIYIHHHIIMIRRVRF